VRFRLFSLGLDFLASGVVLGLDLAQVGVGRVALGGELVGIFGVALAEVFESSSVVLEGFGDLRDEIVPIAIVLGSAGLEGSELGGPGREGGTGGVLVWFCG